MRATRGAMPALLVLVTVAGSGGCGGSPAKKLTTPPLASKFDPTTCTGAWRSVYQSAPAELSPGTGDLAWKDGTLFVAHSASSGYSWVFSIPDHGGAKNLLYEGHLNSFWLQDQNLIYSQNYDLFDMPRTGGPPTKILHYGDAYYDPAGGGGLYDRVLDDTAIYWLLYGNAGTIVWQHLRSGGADTILTMISSTDTNARSEWMRQASGQLVLGLWSNVVPPVALVVPKGTASGASLSLPVPSNTAVPLTTSDDGTLLWTDSMQTTTPPFISYTLSRQPLDGTPAVPFTTKMPPTAQPIQAYAAGQSAWYVAAVELDKANAAYLSVWYVQSDGSAQRLGCDATPLPGSTVGQGQTAGRPTAGVAADGAFYLAVVYRDGSWNVVGLDNPSSAPDTGDVGGVPGAPIVDGGANLGVDAGASCPAYGDGGFDAGSPLPQYTITEFPVPSPKSGLQNIVPGPEGSLWFNEVQTGYLGRVTPGGCVQEINFGAPYPGYAEDLVPGRDGNIWITQAGIDEIGRVSIDGTMLREFPLLKGSARLDSITVGPDGYLWFTESVPSAIARMTTDGTITEFPTPRKFAAPAGIVTGPDGNLWFVETSGYNIGRLDPSTGTITEFVVPNSIGVGAPVPGPDGNLWTLASTGAAFVVVKITPAGTITETPFPDNTGVGGMVAGPDGNLWMTETDANNIVLMSPAAGTFKKLPIPTAKSSSYGITVGPDGNIWFVEGAGNRIGRVTL